MHPSLIAVDGQRQLSLVFHWWFGSFYLLFCLFFITLDLPLTVTYFRLRQISFCGTYFEITEHYTDKNSKAVKYLELGYPDGYQKADRLVTVPGCGEKLQNNSLGPNGCGVWISLNRFVLDEFENIKLTVSQRSCQY